MELSLTTVKVISAIVWAGVWVGGDTRRGEGKFNQVFGSMWRNKY